MKYIDLQGIHYIGADIVKQLLHDNSKKYTAPNIEFRNLNACDDDLPTVDLIFCRDMLVHLPYDRIKKALTNFKKSGSKYLLVTTNSKKQKNKDIPTGKWRRVNFTKPPFNFPEPIVLINEKSTEKKGHDKCLGLWRLQDLPF